MIHFYQAFKLIVKNPQLPVPPGMEIAAIIEFQTNSIIDYNEKLVVSIDSREVDIPLIAFPAKPILNTTGNKLNFYLNIELNFIFL